ncbi:hypothetical protein GQR58_021386 [Nymphon striatum]|nr:hypothetical protein GQR58_021386 [Nymphon striatum]
MAVFKPLHLPAVNALYDTRWSERHDGTHALKVGYTAIVEVLKNMASDEDEKMATKEKALGFIKTMATLETGIMVEFLSCILERFHKTSKALQDSKLDINAATHLLDSLDSFVQVLQSSIFEGRGAGQEA